MTILLAAPIPATQAPTTRCRCGGYLTAAGRLVHVDTCADCLDDDPTRCDLREIHHTCTDPRPVECLHYRCSTDVAIGAGDRCTHGHDNCCTCCLTD